MRQAKFLSLHACRFAYSMPLCLELAHPAFDINQADHEWRDSRATPTDGAVEGTMRRRARLGVRAFCMQPLCAEALPAWTTPGTWRRAPAIKGIVGSVGRCAIVVRPSALGGRRWASLIYGCAYTLCQHARGAMRRSTPTAKRRRRSGLRLVTDHKWAACSEMCAQRFFRIVADILVAQARNGLSA